MAKKDAIKRRRNGEVGEETVTTDSPIDSYHFTSSPLTCQDCLGSYHSTMRKRVFELIAGHPALDFVNTLDDRFGVGGPKDLLESYADLVSFTEQSGLLPPKKGARLMREQNGKACERGLHEARHVREALASVLYAFVDGWRTSANELKKLADWIQGTQKKLVLAS